MNADHILQEISKTVPGFSNFFLLKFFRKKSQIQLKTESEHSQEAIDLEDQRYHDLFNSMSQGVLYRDAAGIVITANPAAEEILGLALDQIQGKNLEDCDLVCVHEDMTPFPPEIYPSLQALQTGKKIKNIVMGIYHANQDIYKWILVNSVPQFRRGETRPFQVFSTYTDFSELKKTTDTLKQKEKILEESQKTTLKLLTDLTTEKTEAEQEKTKMTTILSSIGEGVLVTDNQGKIILMNASAEEISGYTLSEVQGKYYLDGLNFINEDGTEHIHFVSVVLRTGTVQHIPSNLLLVKKDGTSIPIEETAAPTKSDEGKVLGCVVVFRDKSAEAKLEKTKTELTKRYTLATKSAKIGVWDWDVKRNILTWDDQMYTLHGIQKEDFTGAYDAWQSVLYPEDKKRGDEEIQLALAGKKDFNTTFRVLWPNKEVHYIRAFAIVERNIQGEAVKMVGVNFDVTHEKEVDQAKSEFVSVASHELKTPLGIMKWYLESIKDDESFVTLSEQLKEYINDIYQSNERILDVVRSLLDVSRIEQGRVKDDPKATNIVTVIRNMIKELKPQEEKQNVSVMLTADETIPEIMIDSLHLSEVFQNVLSNAIKYNKKDGHVDITVTKNDQAIHITVSDTGIGIPAKDKEKLFTKFFRAENVYNSVTEGTGLGLYVVKSYIEGWGGTINIQSTENIGTQVTIEIPLVPKTLKKL